jgi:C4-dicarboxylate transporter, DctM subunit
MGGAMAESDFVAIAGFVVLFAMLALRVPVGIAMGLVGVGGFAAITGPGPALNLLAQSPIRTITDFNLTLIPFFILMGVFATNSGMSRELFRTGQAWLGSFRGGLALSTIGACAGFAAICGSSVATAATMTKVALPEMKRFGYGDDVSSGVIAAGGTLGILIPPSIVLAVYAFITEQDVGRLFIAGIVPGILAIVMYMLTVRIAYARSLPAGERFSLREAIVSLRGVWAVLLLFVAIIGSIYFGIVTATEAAAVGSLLTALIGIARGRLNTRLILDSLIEALRTSVAIYTILIGAILFGYFLAITQTPQKITAFLVSLDFGAHGTLALILVFFIVMGCILDAMAMIILLVPIVFPVITQLGFDPIWFGVIIVMTVELGLITPPVGMNVFVINTIARHVSLPTIFKGVMPFVLTDIIRLILLVLFPSIVLFLPQTMN